jgi:hypothetical protein
MEEIMIKEDFMMSDYQFYSERRSQIDSNKTYNEPSGFGCPHCHEVIRNPVTPPHGELFIHRCGLRMLRRGNSLQCELQERD